MRPTPALYLLWKLKDDLADPDFVAFMASWAARASESSDGGRITIPFPTAEEMLDACSDAARTLAIEFLKRQDLWPLGNAKVLNFPGSTTESWKE